MTEAETPLLFFGGIYDDRRHLRKPYRDTRKDVAGNCLDKSDEKQARKTESRSPDVSGRSENRRETI